MFHIIPISLMRISHRALFWSHWDVPSLYYYLRMFHVIPLILLGISHNSLDLYGMFHIIPISLMRISHRALFWSHWDVPSLYYYLRMFHVIPLILLGISHNSLDLYGMFHIVPLSSHRVLFDLIEMSH
jgi:hypothetical protein